MGATSYAPDARSESKGGPPPRSISDPEADALYIKIREAARPTDNIDIEEAVTVDVDEQRHIVGLEVLDGSKRLSSSDLTSITIEKLPLEATTP